MHSNGVSDSRAAVLLRLTGHNCKDGDAISVRVDVKKYTCGKECPCDATLFTLIPGRSDSRSKQERRSMWVFMAVDEAVCTFCTNTHAANHFI